MQRRMAVEPSNLTGEERRGSSSVAGTLSSIAGGRSVGSPFIRCSNAGWLAYLSVEVPPPLHPEHTNHGPRLACLIVALGRHEWLQSDSAAYSATPYRSPPVGEESRGRSATPLTAMRQSQRNTERGDTHALLTSRTERAVLLELLRPVRPGAVLVPELRPGTAPGMLWPVRPGAVPEPLLLLMVEWHAAARCAFV